MGLADRFRLPHLLGPTITVRLPDRKLKARNVFTTAVLLIAGGWLSIRLGDDEIFQRFGSLIVIAAVLFAYFDRLSASGLSSWAQASRSRIKEAVNLTGIDDDIEAMGRPWHWRPDAPANERTPCPIQGVDVDLIRSTTGLRSPSSNAAECEKLLALLADDPVACHVLAEHLNRRVNHYEIVLGSIGTLIWGFGDLFIGSFVA